MITSTKCYQAKTGELDQQWYVIDAADQVVGRLAAQIAPILMGKHRPTYTPHIDTGDGVIVINADKVVFTGNKWQQKSYQHYTGYPGGQKDEAAWKLHKRRPTRVLELAIKRMMPKNKIGRHMMAKLKIYAGPTHPHQAQQPIPLEAIRGKPTPAGAIWRPEPEFKPTQPRVEPSPKPESAPAPAPEATAAPTPATTPAEPQATTPPPAES